MKYQKALDIATELHLDAETLEGRRAIIHEARKQAGSLWNPDDEKAHRTAGSFFRNPIVSAEIAEKIMSFDESGKTITEIKKMNSVHGGDSMRVSAAHVMLAAGFQRGQSWGNVRLHQQNLLKIEALDGATAQDIYAVMKHIQETCRQKLSVWLEPEARLLGEFIDA
jgi:UDP-N-acetylmuramate dehydrogenase